MINDAIINKWMEIRNLYVRREKPEKIRVLANEFFELISNERTGDPYLETFKEVVEKIKTERSI